MAEMEDESWLCNVAFLVNVTTCMNELNTRLQQKAQYVSESYKHIKGFMNKYMEMNLGDFYQKYLDQDKFPNLRKFMAYKMALFGSTYLCEQFFSKMGFMKSPYRSMMTDKHLENGLKVASTLIKVNLNRVVQ